jgi:hypothetical protein
MRILIARHNGLGDMVMLFPFIGTYLAAGHQVTVETHPRNHEFLRWVFPSVQTLACTCDPYTDFRQRQHGFDVLLNYNRLELIDGLYRDLGLPALNWQLQCLAIALQAGLPRVADLSPSAYVDYPVKKVRGSVMVFTRSTHHSRTMGPSVVDQLRQKYPNATIDPEYETQVGLAEHIAHADLVIGMDSGAIHVAEAFKTRWVCLHTTFDEASRHQFYKHGVCHQSDHTSSPCYAHDGCGFCGGACPSEFNIKELSNGQ